jgi:uncharacterized integral membrane protein
VTAHERHVRSHRARGSEAVALLIAAVVGALLVATPGSVRVVQLRARLKRANRHS